MIDTDINSGWRISTTWNLSDSPTAPSTTVPPISSQVAPGQWRIMGMGISWEFAKKPTHSKGSSENMVNSVSNQAIEPRWGV